MRKIYAIIPIFFLLSYSSFSHNCNTLEIITTTDASVCGEGSVTLSATSSGPGTDIFWYNAATNGTYGETLTDLDVIGDDLLWYAYQDKIIPLPETTELIDQNIYYVSQTQSGLCESDLLKIMVHRILGVIDPAFANVMALPNPASDRVTISNNGPIESVELYNLLGQRVINHSAGFQTETVLDV